MSNIEVRFFQAGKEFADEIRKSIQESKETCIAVAFVKEDGFNEIDESLTKALSKRYKIKFIIGASTDLGITDYSVLSRLLKLKRKYKRFLVKRYNNAGFHPKLFIFRNENDVKIIIGSSNLTGGGVEKNVEANLILKTEPNNDLYQTIITEFNKWFDGAGKLTDKFLHYYRKKLKQYTQLRRKNTNSLKDNYRTPLPKEEEKYRVDAGPVFWKIAPGRAGWQWKLWKEQIVKGIGIIAIGWEDLDVIMSYDEERAIKEIKNYYGRGVNARYIYKQGKFFYRDMKEGDIVVAYSRGTIFGIGKIIEREPYYQEINNWETKPFPNRRKVEWLLIDKPIKSPKKYAKVLSTYDTIHLIKDEATINYIRRLIEKSI
jgi:HKD family nuclease